MKQFFNFLTSNQLQIFKFLFFFAIFFSSLLNIWFSFILKNMVPNFTVIDVIQNFVIIFIIVLHIFYFYNSSIASILLRFNRFRKNSIIATFIGLKNQKSSIYIIVVCSIIYNYILIESKYSYFNSKLQPLVLIFLLVVAFFRIITINSIVIDYFFTSRAIINLVELKVVRRYFHISPTLFLPGGSVPPLLEAQASKVGVLAAVTAALSTIISSAEPARVQTDGTVKTIQEECKSGLYLVAQRTKLYENEISKNEQVILDNKKDISKYQQALLNEEGEPDLIPEVVVLKKLKEEQVQTLIQKNSLLHKQVDELSFVHSQLEKAEKIASETGLQTAQDGVIQLGTEHVLRGLSSREVGMANLKYITHGVVFDLEHHKDSTGMNAVMELCVRHGVRVHGEQRPQLVEQFDFAQIQQESVQHAKLIESGIEKAAINLDIASPTEPTLFREFSEFVISLVKIVF